MQSAVTISDSLSKIRILLVEDHPDTTTVLRMLLEQRGYSVDTADSAASAREIVTIRTFDIIICDILLRDGTGWDLIRELKPPYTFKAIALSGLGMKADIAMSLEAGFDRHLNKPFNTTHLLATIAELMTVQREAYSELAKALLHKSDGRQNV